MSTSEGPRLTDAQLASPWSCRCSYRGRGDPKPHGQVMHRALTCPDTHREYPCGCRATLRDGAVVAFSDCVPHGRHQARRGQVT